MSIFPAAGALTDSRAGAGKIRYESLFSRRADLGMLLVPVMTTGFAFALAAHRGQNVFGDVRASMVWTSAFLFGNTSHVLLTFLMLRARPDLLNATDRQAKTIIVGSLAVAAVAILLGRLTQNDPTTHILLGVTVAIFAIHHTMSQAKGIWALYSLRGQKAGLPPPSSRERELQKLFVPLALLFIAIKWSLVGELSISRSSPYLNVNPGYPAVLPFALTYGLLAAWLVYVVVLFRALLAYETLNAAKLGYLATQCSVVTLELITPGWGVTIAAGIHGLEYYLLTRKMLAPTSSEAGSRLTSALCWPVMIGAMSPILVVGALTNPWYPLGFLGPSAAAWAGTLIMACVLSHYYADAFLYRLRIPGIRKVVLARVGLG
jgi:hypothetical protein